MGGRVRTCPGMPLVGRRPTMPLPSRPARRHKPPSQDAGRHRPGARSPPNRRPTDPCIAEQGSKRSRARLRRADRPAQARSRQGPPRSGASRLRAPPPLAGHASRGHRGHAVITTEPTDLRAADPTLEHPPASGSRQRRFASLRDDLRPPLTRPLRRAPVLRYRVGGSPWPGCSPRE